MAGDANWANVVLLLQSGTDGTFTDKSSRAASISYSGSGLATSPVKFGSVSLWPQFTYLPYSTDYNLGAGDFTLDGWAYINAVPAPYATIVGNLNDPSYGWRVIVSPEMNLVLNGYWTGQTTITESVDAKVPMNQWFHWAVVRSGNTVTTYVNGATAVTRTATSMGTVNDSTSSLELGGTIGAYWPWPGYIDSVRITKGVARYTGPFTAPTSEFPVGAPYNGDAYSGYVSLMLNCDDSNITDSSAYGRRYSSISGVGLAGVALFGAGSYQFNGSGTGISFPHSATLNLAAGDFTIEAAVNLPTMGNYCLLQKDQHFGSTYTSYGVFIHADGSLQLTVGTGNTNTSVQDVVTAAGALTAGAWHRLAFVRYGTQLRVYIDGSLAQSATQTASPQDGGGPLVLGYNPSGGSNNDWKLNGYVDEVRITKGIARYTGASYTVDAAAFALSNGQVDPYAAFVTTLIALSGVSEGDTSYTDAFGVTLSCTNGTHIATSNTHLGRATIALTGAGNGRVTLSPPSAMNLSTVGASTVEMWIFPTGSPGGVLVGGAASLFNSATSTGGMGGFFVTYSTSGQLGLYFREYYCVAPSASGVFVANQWNHVAVSFVGYTAYLHCNGALVGSGTVSNGATGLSGSDYAAIVGTIYSDATPAGSLGQFRVTKGIARYTGSSYPVPSAPFDATPGMFTGTVADGAGQPAVRTILAYRRDTGALIGTTQSSSSGTYSLGTTYLGEHDLVCLDSTGSLPDLILSRVMPQ